MSRTRTDDLVGVTLEGGYVVEAVVGEGHDGGTVYSARDAKGARFAVRCPRLAPDYSLREEADALARFAEEAVTLADLGRASADIEQLVSHGVTRTATRARVPFTVFAWLEGKPLDRWAATHPGPRSLGEVVAILGPVFRALMVAHAKGVVHRDVRPGNVWIAKAEGRTAVKLTGFTLASHLARGEPSFAPTHGAPEHFKRAYGAFSPATDVYGLGLLLVELVTGAPALVGSDAAELYLCTSDLAKRPTLRARGAQVGAALEAVIARALAVDPRRRYATAQELWDAVRGAAPELTPAPPSVRPAGVDVTESSVAIPGIGGAPGALGVGAFGSTSPSGTAAVVAPTRGDARRTLLLRATAVVGMALLGAGGARIVLGSRADVPAAPKHTVAVPTASAPVAVPVAASEPADAGGSDSGEDDAGELVGLRAFPTDMLRVPAGTFTMGVDREGKGDGPAHRVTLTRAFYIDRTEVTTTAYAACVQRGACTPVGVHVGDVVESTYGCNTDRDRPTHPVNCVDRSQAERFCAFAGKRLPTEAEWEYAARGAEPRAYPWGDEPPTTCEQAVLPAMTGACGERKGTAEVAATVKGTSPFGAYDMAGNVWEWVTDAYEPYPSGAVTDPHVPAKPGFRGILRGGSWDYSEASAKTTFRLPFAPANGNVSIGFRCARDAD